MDQAKATIAARARSLVRSCDSGMLATQSKSHPGYPFASLSAFALDRDACPVILVSRLAEHSRNLAADPRASLLVQRPSADPQAAARATLLVDASPHAMDEALRARYARQVPGALELLELGDFFFMRLQPVAIRFIGGFGEIHWVKRADFMPPRSAIPDAERELLASLDSSHAVRLLAYRALGHEAARVEVIGVDGEGVDLRADGTRLRFDFAAPVSEPSQVAQAIATLIGSAR